MAAEATATVAEVTVVVAAAERVAQRAMVMVEAQLLLEVAMVTVVAKGRAVQTEEQVAKGVAAGLAEGAASKVVVAWLSQLQRLSVP